MIFSAANFPVQLRLALGALLAVLISPNLPADSVHTTDLWGLVGLMATAASAQIKIGAIISITGPTAALGVGYKSAFATFPAEIDGKRVTYIIRDDAADASQAVTIAQRMIEEDHVDAIIGPTLTSSDYAVQPIANVM